MWAAVIDRFWGLEVLTLHTLPAPELDAGEVLIALDTAGMGSWDADIREGWRPTGMRVRFPLVLATDGAGTVAEVGSRVRRFEVGDRVYSHVRLISSPRAMPVSSRCPSGGAGAKARRETHRGPRPSRPRIGSRFNKPLASIRSDERAIGGS